MTTQLYLSVAAGVGLLALLNPAIRIVWQYQRGVVFRFGKLIGERGPGLNFILPYIDRMLIVENAFQSPTGNGDPSQHRIILAAAAIAAGFQNHRRLSQGQHQSD